MKSKVKAIQNCSKQMRADENRQSYKKEVEN